MRWFGAIVAAVTMWAQVGDAVTTYFIVSLAGTTAAEANPIARFMLDAGGWPLMFAAKAGLIVYLVWLTRRFWAPSPDIPRVVRAVGRLVTAGGAVFQTGIVAWNSLILWLLLGMLGVI